MQIDAIIIKEQDNVATALRNIQPNEEITMGMGDESKPFVIQEFISYGHKFSVKDIALGENILKYGGSVRPPKKFVQEHMPMYIILKAFVDEEI